MGISMRKSFALLLVLVFLPASFLIGVKPVSAAPWASKAPMNEARGGLGVVAVNGKIYAIGGSTRQGGGDIPFTGGVVGTNEEYDPVPDTWTFKKPMPTPRCNFGIAVYQNKIYCISAEANEVYDPATDTWEAKTPMPTPRSYLTANVLGGKIYLIGGYVPDNSDFGFSISALNEVYDPETDSWTTKEPMPTAASDYASAVVDKKIYIIGGQSKASHSNLNQIYDPETDTWSIGAPSPSGIRYGACAAGATTGLNAPKRIYVLGEIWNLWEGEPPNSNRIYDPASDSWSFGVDVPTKRGGFGVAIVDDMLYAIGGQNITQDWYGNSYSTPYTTNEQYTPIGYGTVPPLVVVVSPESKTYNMSSVSLKFAVNKPAAWIGYSLDGHDNVTITGNTTLTGLSNGLHNLTVYTKDAFENVGASETVYFIIAEESEPFPTTWIVGAAALIAVGGAAALVYFRKTRKTTEKVE
jgi:N-acetylneuraminic acid mutarotase